LATRLPEGTDDDVIDRFTDENEQMKELGQRITEAKRKLSMAQLGALIELQGKQIEEHMKRLGL